MQQGKCYSVRDSLLKHIAEITIVEQSGSLCVATLPVVTLDGRLVDVFIEPRVKDYYLVHDAGKAMNELILQGIKITPSVERDFVQLSQRFNVGWVDEMFQTGCKIEKINTCVMSIAACSSLAMFHALGHSASEAEDESVRDEFREALKKWSRGQATFKENVQVRGAIKQHTFDFVAHPKVTKIPIAISVLSPTAGSLSAAERFGFKVKDLQDTAAGHWKRVVVEARAETWSAEARNIIHQCADAVICVESGRKPTQSEIGEAILRVA